MKTMTIPNDELSYTGSEEQELDYHALNAKVNLVGVD